MFSDCYGLKTLDLKNFNTNNVTNMKETFYRNLSLTALDLRNWNVDKVTDKENALYMAPTTIKITINDDSIKDWAKSTNTNLTDSNFVRA